MNRDQILNDTRQYVKKTLLEEGSGHDWWHIFRVTKMALYLARKEGGDPFIIELAALLHDLGDWKFHDGDDTVGAQVARGWLWNLGITESEISHITNIIQNISFKGAHTTSVMKTIEGEIVQDADRLDAIGAIGIARTFTYGGSRRRLIYDPSVKPVLAESFEEYKNHQGPTINHFSEKLLLLKDRMNTKTAKKIAKKRHAFMKEYLKEFFIEWEGEGI